MNQNRYSHGIANYWKSSQPSKLWLQKLLPLIWSSTCIICELPADDNIDLCSYCLPRLPWLSNYCYQCGKQNFNSHKYDSYRCKTCDNNPPEFDRFYSLFIYKPPITKLIARLKFQRKLEYATVFGKLLSQMIPYWYNNDLKLLPQAIIPMPLHSKRLRWRGFNQVIEILKPVIREHNLPLATELVMRKNYTTPQATLTKQLRQRNLKHAFTLGAPAKYLNQASANYGEPLTKQQLERRRVYDHVAVVDDVLTTGSTMRALCKQLRRAGIEQIDVWCISRA